MKFKHISAAKLFHAQSPTHSTHEKILPKYGKIVCSVLKREKFFFFIFFIHLHPFFIDIGYIYDLLMKHNHIHGQVCWERAVPKWQKKEENHWKTKSKKEKQKPKFQYIRIFPLHNQWQIPTNNHTDAQIYKFSTVNEKMAHVWVLRCTAKQENYVRLSLSLKVEIVYCVTRAKTDKFTCACWCPWPSPCSCV